jgi:hypothetical protein
MNLIHTVTISYSYHGNTDLDYDDVDNSTVLSISAVTIPVLVIFITHLPGIK